MCAILHDRYLVVHISFVSYGQISLSSPSLVLYSFRANLLHSLIIWLIISSLSQNNLHLQFSCVLSIHTLIWLVIMTLFCDAIWRDSVSLLRFPFHSHFQFFPCDMLLICLLIHPWNCFSSHFCFVIIVILLVFFLTIVSGSCNQSSSVLFNVVLKSYLCVITAVNAGESFLSLLFWYI